MIANAKLMLAAVLFSLLVTLTACNTDSIQSLPEATDPGPGVLNSLAIVPASFTIAPGAQLQFRVFGLFSNGSSQDYTDLVVWSSSDTGLVSIDSVTGMATGGSGEGSADISALDPVTNISGQTTLTVSSAAIPAIYVATTGIDGPTLGLTPSDPVATLNYAIQRAQTEGLNRVRVQAGTYPGIVVVQDGISLEGGYDANWDFIPLTPNKATITGGLDGPTNRYMTVKIVGLPTQTMLSDLHIVGPNASGSVGQVARSSYAVYVSNSSNLVLAGLDIDSGNGAPGLSGSSGSSASQSLPPPAQGGGNAALISCGSGSNGAIGGSGGGAIPARGGNGGNGGRAESTQFLPGICLTVTYWYGASGFDAYVVSLPPLGYGGAGGSNGTNNCSIPGSGNPGRPPQHGSGGPGGANSGAVVGGFWDGGLGGTGTLGLTGEGGGGGGGSGGCYNGINTVSKGAGGGGGGAGGQTAPSSGLGGRDGGSSFGVFATNSSLSVGGTQVQRGNGGSGGIGGSGGLGQPGGIGGFGGNPAGVGRPGGNGGQGGGGGNSGGGGGGAGGNSYGIFTNASPLTQSGNSFFGGSGGSPGNGGSSPTSGGSPGQAGSVNTIIEQ